MEREILLQVGVQERLAEKVTLKPNLREDKKEQAKGGMRALWFLISSLFFLCLPKHHECEQTGPWPAVGSGGRPVHLGCDEQGPAEGCMEG